MQLAVDDAQQTGFIFLGFFKRQGHIEKILLVTFVPHVSVREAGDL